MSENFTYRYVTLVDEDPIDWLIALVKDEASTYNDTAALFYPFISHKPNEKLLNRAISAGLLNMNVNRAGPLTELAENEPIVVVFFDGDRRFEILFKKKMKEAPAGSLFLIISIGDVSYDALPEDIRFELQKFRVGSLGPLRLKPKKEKESVREKDSPDKKTKIERKDKKGPVDTFPYMTHFLPDPDIMLERLRQKPKIKLDSKFKFDNKYSPVIQINLEDFYLADAITNHFTEAIRIHCQRNKRDSPWTSWQKFSSYLLNKAKTIEPIEGIEENIDIYQQREALYNLSAGCNNFSVTLGVYIIRKLGAKRVLDSSAGWGDRAIAAIAAGVEIYRGYDPNDDLLPGYQKIEQFADSLDVDCSFSIEPFDLINVKEVKEQYGLFDLVLTSPPYFDLEIYGEQEGQSVTRFPTYEEWKEGFLRPYLNKAWSLLQKEGHLAIYIEDVREMKLTEDVKEFLTKKNASYRGVIGLQTMGGQVRPTFVWKKE